MTLTKRHLSARRNLDRITRVETGQASTKDFTAMGLPFEAFLRYSQMSKSDMRHVATKMREWVEDLREAQGKE